MRCVAGRKLDSIRKIIFACNSVRKEFNSYPSKSETRRCQVGCPECSPIPCKIAQNLTPTSKFLNGRDPGLSADGWFRTEHQVYPYGCNVAVVAVDRETGNVAVERYCIAYDIGRAINPALVEGQIVGGFAQGFGGALFEEFTYSERGDPLAATFAALSASRFG